MKILRTARRHFHKKYLEKMLNVTHQSKTTIQPHQAKHIAILFDANKAEHRQIIDEYNKKLQRHQKKVTIFAYLDNPSIANGVAFRFFDKKTLNWFGIPKKSESVKRFLSQPYDMLLCFYQGEHLPLEYVAAMTQAGFKVGQTNNDRVHFDLTIHHKKDDLKYFISRIDYFLNRMTASEDSKAETEKVNT